MKDNHGLTRRHLLLTGSLVVGGVAVQLPKSLAKLLRPFNISEGIAKAQDNVKDLKPFPLKKLRELDAVMDRKYQRIFWEDKEGYYVTAKVNGENGNYVIATAGTISTTMVKELAIQFPKDRSKPTGDMAPSRRADLTKLHDLYLSVCPPGCEKKDKFWTKIIYDVHENSVDVFVMFVDEKPRPGDSSDIKHGYPFIVRIYDKTENKVYKADPEFYRAEDNMKVARK